MGKLLLVHLCLRISWVSKRQVAVKVTAKSFPCEYLTGQKQGKDLGVDCEVTSVSAGDRPEKAHS